MKCSKAYFSELSLLHSTHGLIFMSDVSVRKGFCQFVSLYLLFKEEGVKFSGPEYKPRKWSRKETHYWNWLYSYTLPGMRCLHWGKCKYALMARQSCLQHHLPVWACPKCDRQVRNCQSVTFLALACAACVNSDISAKTHDSLKMARAISAAHICVQSHLTSGCRDRGAWIYCWAHFVQSQFLCYRMG